MRERTTVSGGSEEGVCIYQCPDALLSSGTRLAPTMDWWQGSRAATSSQCWTGSGNFTAVATARDVRIPAGESES